MHEIFSQLRPLLIAITLSTPRLLVIFWITPFFKTVTMNSAIRNCLVMVFSLIVLPTMLSFVRDSALSLGIIFTLVVKEAIIGTLIGYLVSLFFQAIEAVGFLIDFQRGASFASVIDPATGQSSSILGSFLVQATIVLFFCSGGFLLFLSGVYESYRVWPIATYWPSFDPEFGRFFLARVDEMMTLAFLLASPILIVFFFSDLGLGLINRFAPQLNVFFLSMPVKSALSTMIMIIYLPFLLFFIKNNFIQRADVFALLRQVVH